jgi:hypothetical protein
MPVQIGTETHNFSDPTGLLTDCHRRIEMFLAALERIAAIIKPPCLGGDPTRAGFCSPIFRRCRAKTYSG